MSDSTDTSNCSVIFVSEQKKVTVDVHPIPPNGNNFVPNTQENNMQDLGQGQSTTTTEDDISVIPETGKYKFFLQIFKTIQFSKY